MFTNCVNAISKKTKMRKFFATLLTLSFSGIMFSQVGINTTIPKQTLDVEGTLRLSETPLSNNPSNLFKSNPLFANTNNGQVQYAPNGFSTTAGGYRPGKNVVLKTFPVTNTLVRVSFVHYVDESSDLNNSVSKAYTYGEFTIVGTGNSNPIHFVDVQIKGADGNAKTFTNNGTAITWDNGNQRITSLTLNQTTGDLEISDETYTFSYFFNFLGGI